MSGFTPTLVKLEVLQLEIQRPSSATMLLLQILGKPLKYIEKWLRQSVIFKPYTGPHLMTASFSGHFVTNIHLTFAGL